jgi:hypothetical protein
LGARYGPEVKQFIVEQKWTSIALAFGRVLVFFLVRWLLAFRRAEYSQTD